MPPLADENYFEGLEDRWTDGCPPSRDGSDLRRIGESE
jgi:hypothetical protein